MDKNKVIEWLKVIREAQSDGLSLSDRREALDMAIRYLKKNEEPKSENAETDVAQIKWERDTAVSQLQSIGVSLAEDMGKVAKKIELERKLMQCISNGICLDMTEIAEVLGQYIDEGAE